MANHITQQHFCDTDENPAGGNTWGTGFTISWQNGPLNRHPVGTVAVAYSTPNGAFVEDIIKAALGRLEFYQEGDIPGGEGKFACRENALAITKLQEALHWLEHRTRDRRNRGVEGTLER